MNSTELHSKTDIRRHHSTRKPDGCQHEKNTKVAITTFPADSPLIKWQEKQKNDTEVLPTKPDGAKLKSDENADKMNFVSNFATGPAHFPLPESEAIIERMEQLETRYKLNHTELAKEIGISRSSVHATLKGRTPTQKLIKKLEAAEKRLEATTLQTVVTNQSMLVFAMKSAIPEEKPTAPNEVFVRPKGGDGNTHPDGTIITLTPPPVIKGIGAIVRAHVEDRCNDLIKSCLPKEFANDEWIENLSPTSYLSALKKAVILILGPTWKAEFTKLITEAEAQSKTAGANEPTPPPFEFHPDPDIKPFPTSKMPEMP